MIDGRAKIFSTTTFDGDSVGALKDSLKAAANRIVKFSEAGRLGNRARACQASHARDLVPYAEFVRHKTGAEDRINTRGTIGAHFFHCAKVRTAVESRLQICTVVLPRVVNGRNE